MSFLALGATDSKEEPTPEGGGAVGKLILLIIIGLAVGMYFPDSRAVLMDKGEPVLRPLLIWNAEREIEKIVLGVQQNEQIELRLPDRRQWVKWVEDPFAGEGSRDPWGNFYQYEIQEDSFAVISIGPDRLGKTEDDIRDVRLRNWRAKGKDRP